MTGPSRVPLVVSAGAAALLLLDTTVVYVGLPVIGVDLDTSFALLQWTIDAYTLALAATLLTAGALADRFGRRRVLVGGLALFAVASAACAAAPTGGTLVAARAVQGLGGAACFSASLAVLAAAYTGAARARALAIWGAVGGAALALGPAVGGLVIGGPGWRWLFAVNVPIALGLAWLARGGITETRDTAAPAVGLRAPVLAAAGPGLLVAATIRGPDAGWGSPEIVGGYLLGTLVVFALLVDQARSPAPLVDLGALRTPAAAGLALFALGQSVAIYPVLLLVSFELQDVRGYDALDAGLRVLPLTLGLFAAAAYAGRLVARQVLGNVLVAGLVLVLGGVLLLRSVTPLDPWEALLPGLTLLGAGSGILSPAFAAAMLAVLPDRQAGVAAGLANTLRQLGISAGVAATCAIVAGSLQGDRGASGALGFDASLDDALLVCAGAAAVAIVGAACVRVRA